VSAEAKDLICRMLTVNVNNRISAKEIFDHPWMKMKSSSKIGCHASDDTCQTSINGTDALKDKSPAEFDITENLESIRDHQAKTRFEFGVRLFDRFLGGSLRKSNLTDSNEVVDPNEFAKTIAYEAKQAEQLHRLHTAITTEVF